jgi:ATP-dependent 26S proteasome regulatory subunit
MDLKQRKLNKSEWDSIEIPVSETEICILNLIMAGYHNVTSSINKNNSIFTYLKIEFSEKMEDYIYNRFLRKRADQIEKLLFELDDTYKFMKIEVNIKPNSSDRVRLERFDEDTIKNNDIYEFLLMTHIENLLTFKNLINTKPLDLQKNTKLFNYHYYTLYKLIRNNIIRLNRHVINLVNIVLDKFIDEIDKSVIIENAVEFIEKNDSLLKYSDLVLYKHQKDIFATIKTPTPKLILYMAPTGTGKTLTPIALSEKKKVIFVCAARHVGLALARAAISVNKKIAFAFGCSSADDIRLHYFAAKEFTRNKRTGGIGKVDNSVGDNVEIIICDIRSYLPAMYYMLAFFPANNICTYWDEPTITMDYDEHEFHKTIRKNWKENVIPTVVLSSATLPKENELTQTIPDFLNKFPGAEICNIVSHDCKKSIPIVNKDGFVVLPHYLSNNYNEMLRIANHCRNYLTLLRYFDLKEVVEFITFINKNNYANNRMRLDRHFEDLDSINMTNIKIYYVEMLKNINPVNWQIIYTNFEQNRKPRVLENTNIDTKGNRIHKIRSIGPGVTSTLSNSLAGAPLSRLASEQITSSKPLPQGTSGVYVTTKDAYTLTDGPTIFISNDIEKIAKFCVQQANIPAAVMDDLMNKIEYNNIINKRIYDIDVQIDVIKEDVEKQVKNNVNEFHKGISVKGRTKSNKDPKKLSKDIPDELQNKGSLNKMTQEVNSLRALIKRASLNDTFVPNKKQHLEKWAPDMNISNAFTSSIDEQVVADIMALNGVDNLWKILLMMGIGVFINHENITYTEIMKKLADEQKLYMIIASSDYIYGTNYQFCHGFLSKDLDLTQEKVIQAMGRIGRNNIQQTYTIRFRDDSQIVKLFTSETDKPEVKNMNILFNSTKVKYENGEYIEIPEENDEEEEVEE